MHNLLYSWAPVEDRSALRKEPDRQWGWRQTECTSLALKVLARPHSYTFLGPTLYILCQTPFFVAREDHTLKTKLINT